ncbi:MAG: hypothetical protein IJB41_09190 [Clostridia bacterium]|nr:hypothetical protein [Clostridia bacterium]
MKKLFPILLAFVFVLSLLPSSFAQSEAAPVLGGTKEWPEFRGMQFGLRSTAVIYREADAGTPIVCHRNGGSSIDISEAATARAYPVITSEPIDVLGKGAYLRYEFQDGTFTQATLYWPMNSDEEALEWLKSVSGHVQSVFGAPDTLKLRTADGDTIPADPQDDYYTLFEDSIENYGKTTPVFGWNLGKLFTFSDRDLEAYEGGINAYTKTVESDTLEAAIGLETGKPAVVLHVARVFYPQASGSYLPK